MALQIGIYAENMADRLIIDWLSWTQSPPGRYLLAWEQSQLDQSVPDIFGYHALQLGLPQINALRENRMPYRGLVLDAKSSVSAPYTYDLNTSQPSADSTEQLHKKDLIWCDFPELPFDTQSVDLLVLPHTLELTQEPHYLLREAERVLLPEGRLIILGFNSLSLWGLQQLFGRTIKRPFLPEVQNLIAFSRLKDWLKLLGFELNRGRFGCYRPAFKSQNWLDRCAFMESAGDRWWPILGATYMITAVKRVRSVRLITPKQAKPSKLVPSFTSVITPSSFKQKDGFKSR